MHSHESGPMGRVETRPPLAFFSGVCSGGYMFSIGGLTPTTPRQFLPCVCLLARLLKNAWMNLDEMLRVDRCRDMDELINF